MITLSPDIAAHQRYDQVRILPSVHIFGGKRGVVLRSKFEAGRWFYDVELSGSDYQWMRVECCADAITFEQGELEAVR